MKNVLLLTAFALLPLLSWGQTYPVVSIHDVQYVSLSPDTCNDSSYYALKANAKDTIIVRGIAMMDGTASQASVGKDAEIYLQAAPGIPWGGVDIFGTVPTSPDDIYSQVYAGDSLEIIGTVEEFGSATEVVPISVTYLGPGNQAIYPTVHKIAEFNNSNRVNYMTSGEQWEGTYIEFRNCTVVDVTINSSNGRITFDIVDSSGGKMYVYDRFLVQRPASNNPPGTFVAPNVGDKFNYIRGIMTQTKSSCSSGYYELAPFQSTDYGYGVAAPSVTHITRDKVNPTSAQTVTVSATITSHAGVDTTILYYATGVGSTTWVAVPMVVTSGSTYSATIPALANGTFVSYYIHAADSSSSHLATNFPNVQSGGTDPIFYLVDDAGTTIYDIQYTPYSDGSSGLNTMVVTVSGIVTATVNDLGYVVIQQPGVNAWSGLWLATGTGLAGLNMGDSVTVTGTVKENFGYTELTSVTVVNTTTPNSSIVPLTVDPDMLTTYTFPASEQYEGMLLQLVNPVTPNPMYVISTHPTGETFYGQFVLGDTASSKKGARILVGSTSEPSSLNVSYISNGDSSFASNLNVTAVYVAVGNTIDTLVGIGFYDYDNTIILPRMNGDVKGFRVGSITGVQSGYVSSNFTVYPNPANSELNVSLNSTISGATIAISDLTGRQLMTQSLNSTSMQMDVSSLNEGMYFLSISSGNGIVEQAKFVIKK